MPMIRIDPVLLRRAVAVAADPDIRKHPLYGRVRTIRLATRDGALYGLLVPHDADIVGIVHAITRAAFAAQHGSVA